MKVVLEAAGRVGAMHHAMIESMEEPSDEAKEFQVQFGFVFIIFFFDFFQHVKTSDGQDFFK